VGGSAYPWANHRQAPTSTAQMSTVQRPRRRADGACRFTWNPGWPYAASTHKRLLTPSQSALADIASTWPVPW